MTVPSLQAVLVADISFLAWAAPLGCLVLLNAFFIPWCLRSRRSSALATTKESTCAQEPDARATRIETRVRGAAILESALDCILTLDDDGRIVAAIERNDQAIRRILQVLGESMNWDAGSYWGLEENGAALRCLAFWQRPEHLVPELERVTRAMTLARRQDLPGRIWDGLEPICLENLAEEIGIPRRRTAEAAGFRTAMGFPLSREQTFHGVLEFFGKNPLAPDDPWRQTYEALRGPLGLFFERRIAQTSLMRREHELADFFQNAPLALLWLGPTGAIQKINHAALNLLGYRQEEVVGRNFADFHLDGNLFAAFFARLRSGGTLRNSEMSLRCRDGSLRDVLLDCNVLWEEGRFCHARCFARDITGQKKAQAALLRNSQDVERARAQIQEQMVRLEKQAEDLREASLRAGAANDAKSQFLANMSHEIRTPLNGILGMTALALETELTDEQREYLEMVQNSGRALLRVINDILDFSKIEAGKLEMDPVAFDLRDSMTKLIRPLALQAHAKELELICLIHPDVPDWIIGDPVRLNQVLLNLLGNALKFTKRGEIVLEVKRIESTVIPTASGIFRLERGKSGSFSLSESCQLQFTVRDTGIGILRDKQQLIFAPFAQVDGSTTRKYGGTGLGLTISMRLVEMMHGRLWLESALDQGTKFHFTIRCTRAKASRNVATLTPDALKGLSVLVVDDNDTNRLILKELLTGWQMKPTCAGDGRQGLEELSAAADRGEPYALVLLDAIMPELDGFGVAGCIQKKPDLAAATVLMLSSADRPGDAARCRQLGVRSYLTKPILPADLMQTLLSSLGQARQEAPDEPSVSPEPQRVTGQDCRTRSSLRILLAEDNLVNQKLVLRLLEKQGHRVNLATDGCQALQWVQKEQFDLVLMDVQMPEMDGLEATAAIRAWEMERDGNIPIIAMTAHAMKGDKERCLAAGMDGYISKPIRPDDLIRIIEEMVGTESTLKRLVGPAPKLTAPALDEQLLLTRVEGDLELARDLAELFLSEGPRYRTQIQEALQRGDCDAVYKEAHALKGALSNFGALAALELVFRLEWEGRSRRLEEARVLWGAAQAEVMRLEEALKEFALAHRATEQRAEAESQVSAIKA